MTKKINTKVENCHLRYAQEDDIPLIFQFIKDLAEYEKMADEVVATESQLKEHLFGDHSYAEVILAYYDDSPAGFALFFHSFSTFLERPGIYLEDLFVKPEYRGQGIGTSLLSYLAKVAVERDCGRLEWAVLDWNTPSIEFYKYLDAKPVDDWTRFRLAGDSLVKLSEDF